MIQHKATTHCRVLDHRAPAPRSTCARHRCLRLHQVTRQHNNKRMPGVTRNTSRATRQPQRLARWAQKSHVKHTCSPEPLLRGCHASLPPNPDALQYRCAHAELCQHRVLRFVELRAAAVYPLALQALAVEERIRACAMPDVALHEAVKHVACIPSVA